MNSRKKIENHIKNAVTEMTPELLNQISSAPVTKTQQEDWMMDKTMKKEKTVHTKRYWGIGLAAACAVLVMVFGAFYYTNYQMVDSVIGLDVNPSVQLTTNKQDKVMGVSALNADGTKVLDGMDLKNVDLDVAVNALVGSMVKHGYISEAKNSILVSVENSNEQHRAEIQKEVSGTVNTALENMSITPTVLQQGVNKTDSIEEIAEKYGISLGKAAFISELMQKDLSLSMDQLAALSIEQLVSLSGYKDIDLDDMLAYGSLSVDQNFIGEAKAQEIALARVPGAQITKLKFDVDDGIPSYDGEMRKGNMEYEFEIHALTGEFLDWETDRLDDDSQNSAPASLIGKDKAKEIALAKAPGAVLVEIELDEDDGVWKYEGELRKGYQEYEFEIDAKTGSVLKWKEDTDDDVPASSTAASNSAVIGQEKAKQIALAKVPGATLVNIELDTDDGKKVYEGELRKGNIEYEFEIDAATGSILKWKEDRDDD